MMTTLSQLLLILLLLLELLTVLLQVGLQVLQAAPLVALQEPQEVLLAEELLEDNAEFSDFFKQLYKKALLLKGPFCNYEYAGTKFFS
ncbi:hypothetical protein EL17_01810 [Anditalea andensis]|uniref:Uncharacterized protein n=1 Tax=Anditalea andensis TaxID=1048983 RepID=A0A074LN20_9BACT|nr:hypothetical protein EL17_01810 [Anditalea andensis]